MKRMLLLLAAVLLVGCPSDEESSESALDTRGSAGGEVAGPDSSDSGALPEDTTPTGPCVGKANGLPCNDSNGLVAK